MVLEIIQKVALSGLAAALAASASFVSGGTREPVPAYGEAASRLEGVAAAGNAHRNFTRADLNKDGFLDSDEFTIFAVVTAELANLNGFGAIDDGEGVKTVPLAAATNADLTKAEKNLIRERAGREFDFVSGDDERLSPDEFISAEFERFITYDRDRNGVLAGTELTSFVAAQLRMPRRNS